MIADELAILKAGWRAMTALERHNQERAGIPALDGNACQPCMRFAVQVSLRGANPRDVLHLRCEQAQEWQRQVWAAHEIIQEEN